MMKMCWAFSPRNRPTFKNLIEMLVPYLSAHFHEVSYFFQEVVHSDADDNAVEYISEGLKHGEEEEDENEDDESADRDDPEEEADQAKVEEEKLIKGNYK